MDCAKGVQPSDMRTSPWLSSTKKATRNVPRAPSRPQHDFPRLLHVPAYNTNKALMESSIVPQICFWYLMVTLERWRDPLGMAAHSSYNSYLIVVDGWRADITLCSGKCRSKDMLFASQMSRLIQRQALRRQDKTRPRKQPCHNAKRADGMDDMLVRTYLAYNHTKAGRLNARPQHMIGGRYRPG